MVSLDRFTVVLDACTLLPVHVRDVLLTLASHEFFSPKWSPAIREEWTRNLCARFEARDGRSAAETKTAAISRMVDKAFPEALTDERVPPSSELEPVDPKDRHVVCTAIAAKADGIITFNIADFASEHLLQVLQVHVLHPDDFIMDLIDLNEKRAAAAFRELRDRKKNPPWDREQLIQRTHASGLVQTSLWLASEDVRVLI